MQSATEVLTKRAFQLLASLQESLPTTLFEQLTKVISFTDEQALAERRELVSNLKKLLLNLNHDCASELTELSDYLVPKSVWIVGGDGWAYDIGYGGLDHVLASHRRVRILVLDTEVYSNTGGQQSKATPMGAVAKFASAGKETNKKDLGLLAMSYGHVYVASLAMQARSDQTMKAFLEAEQHPGPSLLIAHSPCIAHGYDLVHSPEQQKRALASGAWPLYRFDPQRVNVGKSPLQLDTKTPNISMQRYMEEELRFRMVKLRDPERYKRLVAASELASKERRSLYEQLAVLRVSEPKEDVHD
jgi:pyruvate-ferredoxin/flavodoxin oxidoreductase